MLALMQGQGARIGAACVVLCAVGALGGRVCTGGPTIAACNGKL